MFVRTLPGDAHVHDVSAQQERHEGHRPTDGARPSGQEGEERLDHWTEDQNPTGPTRVGEGEALLWFNSVSDLLFCYWYFSNGSSGEFGTLPE